MSIGASLLPEFDHEMANLRKTLERVPEDKLEFKPHAKSPTMGWMANHLANLPNWAVYTMKGDSFDVAAPADNRAPMAATTAEILANLDQSVAAARSVIAEGSDEQMMQTWRLLAGPREIFAMPRVAVLRSMVMNHIIHHRAQLTVYLRLNDVPVPGLYGPSADEQNM